VFLLDRALVLLLPLVPSPMVKAVASRYVAGTEFSDAVAVVRELNETGRMATVDVLGEEVARRDEAVAIAAAYCRVLDTIVDLGLDSNVSLKLTALGLELDRGLCRQNLESVVARARANGSFVRIDMEDASTTDATLGLYRELRADGYVELGIVLQARLRRTIADARALADLRPSVRLCKGIYLEPPELAYGDDDEIRSSFLETLAVLLEQGSYVAVATHDERLLRESARLLAAAGRGPDEYEFQMLLGVRPERGLELVAEGHRLRVYVPFGTHWYEYSLRRLQENPAIAGHVAAATLRRFSPLGWPRGAPGS
jgi:proline dehydrogenase